MSHRGAYQKKQRNIENVRARYQWLVTNIEDPSKLAKSHLPYLFNQQQFARLKVTGTPILPIALNTLKSIADEVWAGQALDGKGFLYLNSLRQRLKTKAVRKSPTRQAVHPRSRRDLSLQTMREKLRLTEVSSLERTQAYVDLYSKVLMLSQSVALDDGIRRRLNHLLEDHRDLHSAWLSPHVSGDPEPRLRVIAGGKE
jgi:hypothetical protein